MGKKILNYLLLILFVATVMVPITGVHIHKLASTLFLVLTVVHTILYRKKLGCKKYFLLGMVIVAFASGLFAMIFDQYPAIMILHKVVSIASVFFLAIHIFVYHKKLCIGKGRKVK